MHNDHIYHPRLNTNIITSDNQITNMVWIQIVQGNSIINGGYKSQISITLTNDILQSLVTNI